MVLREPLPAGTVAVLAPRPTAGPALAFLQLLLGAPNAALSGRVLPGILDPADELVAGQGRDVLPGIECWGVGGQRLSQVRGPSMHHPTWHSLAAHRPHGSKPAARVTIAEAGAGCGWLRSRARERASVGVGHNLLAARRTSHRGVLSDASCLRRANAVP